MDLLPILEWSAFGSSLLCSWVYGYRTIAGPVIGIITAILFMLFGWFSGVPAALAANLVFLIVHTRNGLKMLAEDTTRKLGAVGEGANYLVENIYNTRIDMRNVERFVDRLVNETHGASVEAGWWTNIETGEDLPLNIPLKTVLIHSEISEAMEGHRKNLQDDKLPHRKMFDVELADAAIRIGDLAGKSRGAYKDFGRIFAAELGSTFTESSSSTRAYVYGSMDVHQALCEIHKAASAVYGQNYHTPESDSVDYALARLLITVFQAAHIFEIDLGGAIAEKMEFNSTRPDHKIENRKKGGGKAY